MKKIIVGVRYRSAARHAVTALYQLEHEDCIKSGELAAIRTRMAAVTPPSSN